MNRYAIIESGTVTNVVIWDGEAECAAIPADAVKLDDGSPVGPGYTFEGTSFAAPPAPELPTLPIES